MATPVVIPKQGQSVEACIVVQWLKEVGEQVEADEPLCTVETDKAEFDIVSPVPGVLLAHYFAPGDEVPVHQMIAAVGDPGEQAPAPLAVDDTPAESDADRATAPLAGSAAPPPTTAGRAPSISPRAGRLAATMGIDATALAAGTGPGGRIIERDVMAATPGAEPVPLSGVRRVIAARMSEAAATAAPVTLHAWADARSLTETRRRLALQWGGAGPTFTDLLMAVVARSLPDHSDLNATFDGETITRHAEIHLGLAVDTPRGLLVPVVRNADQLGLGALAAESARLAEACRDGSVLPDELRGATFTLTNLGAFGIEHFTPILNLPQVAILGIGSIRPRPVADDAATTLLPHIGLSLTVDHRVVDGAPAARFVQAIAGGIAEIDRLVGQAAPAEPRADVPHETP